MLLKLGYASKYGKISWEYINEFKDLRVTSCSQRKFLVRKSNEDDYEVSVFNKEDRFSLISTKELNILFSLDIFDEDMAEVYVTHLSFMENNKLKSYVCLSNSVYLMNNDGKIIDKY